MLDQVNNKLIEKIVAYLKLSQVDVILKHNLGIQM